MTNFKRVSIRTFLSAIELARIESELVKINTSDLNYELLEGIDLYLSDDLKSGFGIRTKNGELVNVFSTVKKRGNDLLKFAVLVGATCLDCFDGYLVDFYKKHNFVVYKTVPNWTQGEPSVIYMQLFKK